MTTQAQSQGLGPFKQRGFTLEIRDSHTLFLVHERKFVARLDRLGATEEILQKECARHLIDKHDWGGCL
ncbi:hypothetical protein ES708_00004 [subsurface metagenome]